MTTLARSPPFHISTPRRQLRLGFIPANPLTAVAQQLQLILGPYPVRQFIDAELTRPIGVNRVEQLP